MAAVFGGLGISTATPYSIDQLQFWGPGVTALGFSLLPDIDTASIPQRWFYRISLFALGYLYWVEAFLGLFGLSVFLVLPILGRHRGWTHSKVILPVLFAALLWGYQWSQLARSSFLSPSFMDAVSLYPNILPYLLAAFLGHWTHLVLDSKYLRFLK